MFEREHFFKSRDTYVLDIEGDLLYLIPSAFQHFDLDWYVQIDTDCEIRVGPEKPNKLDTISNIESYFNLGYADTRCSMAYSDKSRLQRTGWVQIKDLIRHGVAEPEVQAIHALSEVAHDVNNIDEAHVSKSFVLESIRAASLNYRSIE